MKGLIQRFFIAVSILMGFPLYADSGNGDFFQSLAGHLRPWFPRDFAHLLILLTFLFFFLTLLTLKRGSKYQLFLSLSFLFLFIWISIPQLLQVLTLSEPLAMWINLGASITAWASLLFLFLSYSYHFTGGAKAGLIIPWIILSLGLLFLSQIGNLYQLLLFTVLREIRDFSPLPYGNILTGLFFLFLILRLIIGLAKGEELRAGALILPLLGLLAWASLLVFGYSIKEDLLWPYLVYIHPFMLFLAMGRLLKGSGSSASKSEQAPGSERILLDLTQTKAAMEKMQQDLADEDSMMGRVIQKSQKLRESLLPAMIHPDKEWEAAVYYQAANAKHPDYYDFMYNYGRKLKGALFFDIQNGMNGSFTGSWLKGMLPSLFNEAPSLSSLYRNLQDGTDLFREGRDLLGQIVRLSSNEAEYCGWGNAPMLFKKASRNRAAQLIQDPVKSMEHLKSYRIEVEPGDAIIMANSVFYDPPHRVTDESYGSRRAAEALGELKGKAGDILKGLVAHRMRFYGEKSFNRGIFLICLRRKTSS